MGRKSLWLVKGGARVDQCGGSKDEVVKATPRGSTGRMGDRQPYQQLEKGSRDEGTKGGNDLSVCPP